MSFRRSTAGPMPTYRFVPFGFSSNSSATRSIAISERLLRSHVRSLSRPAQGERSLRRFSGASVPTIRVRACVVVGTSRCALLCPPYDFENTRGPPMFERLKSLLRAPEQKASRTGNVIALQSAGQARWTPRDYSALTREGYVRNAIVYRAVKLVAENVGGCMFVAEEGGATRDTHPLLDLIARPNPREDGARLIEAIATHLLLAGNAYVEAVSVDAAPRELYALRPDRMKLIPGADGWPEANEYTVAGRSVRFDPSAALPPILHLTLLH